PMGGRRPSFPGNQNRKIPRGARDCQRSPSPSFCLRTVGPRRNLRAARNLKIHRCEKNSGEPSHELWACERRGPSWTSSLRPWKSPAAGSLRHVGRRTRDDRERRQSTNSLAISSTATIPAWSPFVGCCWYED